MDTIVLKVGGMSCGGCVNSVTAVLRQLPGVVRVEVSLEKAQAVVEFDPAQLDKSRMAQAIVDAGFESD
jgi:copper chaperone